MLRTEEGAQRQQSHADHNPRNTQPLENNKISLLAFIPLENNAQLYIWNPSNAILAGTYRNVTVKPSLLTVNKGDLVIFRGDLIHAGSEWNGSAKYRLHCYFHHPLVPFPDNQTWRVDYNTDPMFAHVKAIVDEDNAY